MDEHAVAILGLSSLWIPPNIHQQQESGGFSSKFEAIIPKLLSGFVKESIALGGTVLEKFWDVLGECDPQLKQNVEELKATPFQTSAESYNLLFRGVDQTKVDYKSVMTMTAELFAYVGVAIANPSTPGCASSSPCSPSELVEAKTEELLESLKDGEHDMHNQGHLQALALRRDGFSCPVAKALFRQPSEPTALYPKLTHVIPHSIRDKPDTLQYIALFAGHAMLDKVLKHLDTLDNVLNLQSDAQMSFNHFYWGIEAVQDNGAAKYIFRTIVKYDGDIGFIKLHDGDEIEFGSGPEADVLDCGLLPELCNLRLAVARVLRLSGATDLLEQVAEEADDSGSPGFLHFYVASQRLCDILSAKLLLSGKALWNTV